MISATPLTLNSALRPSLYARDMNTQSRFKIYKRATLTNTHTGDREEIRLFDPQDENNEDYLVTSAHLELKADLKAAFSTFSALEQRILIRVLLQGQSVREATKRMHTKSLRTWERWISEEALPRLCTLLGDYRDELKELPYTPATPSIAPEDPITTTVKCKYCDHVETGKSVTAFRKLESHAAAKHPVEWKAAIKHMKEHDYELARAREEFV